MKDNKNTVKNTSQKKKEKKKEKETKKEEIKTIQEAKTEEQEIEELQKQVNELNNQFINEGTSMFIERLPEKIKELSDFIKVCLLYFAFDKSRMNPCSTIILRIFNRRYVYLSRNTQKNANTSTKRWLITKRTFTKHSTT